MIQVKTFLYVPGMPEYACWVLAALRFKQDTTPLLHFSRYLCHGPAVVYQ